MITYIIRRLLWTIPMLLGITLISFFIIHLAPGKPSAIEQSLNPRVSLEVRERLEKLYGLDKPLITQYFEWIRRIFVLDFGRSFTDNRPVLEKIIDRLGVTLTINVSSLILILVGGAVIGIKSALKPGRLFDSAATFMVFFAFAVPTFWLALLLMQLVSIQLGWLPISGIVSLDYEYFSPWWKFLDICRHLVLPVFVSSIGGLAGVSRYMRSSLLDVLKQPYMLAAKAKGLSQRQLIYGHALRNALLPIVTIVGLSLPAMLGGSVIFESIFALPGVGRLFYEAVMSRDYPLIMAEVVLGAVLTMIGNLLADISYAAVDPRIKYKKA